MNIPVGEVFTSPVLEGTDGILNVSRVYLDGLEYRDLELAFKDGKITDYSCSNFDSREEGRKYIYDNVLKNHETLPLGEFAIGTNTTAYVTARKYGIEEKMPILIAEKTGPHFAVATPAIPGARTSGSTIQTGKRSWQRTTRCLSLRKEDVSKAYFHCHTDITIPYEE